MLIAYHIITYVFYNRLLQCFVLLDLKIGKLSHQDLGQMQMYVNYYDRDIKEDFENPTIGVLLCADKNDAVVRYSLPEGNTQIFASKYQFYLPTEDQLKTEIYDRLNLHDTQLNAIYEAIENLLDGQAVKKSWEERNRIGYKK